MRSAARSNIRERGRADGSVSRNGGRADVVNVERCWNRRQTLMENVSGSLVGINGALGVSGTLVGTEWNVLRSVVGALERW
jgi:hypothetical protein